MSHFIEWQEFMDLLDQLMVLMSDWNDVHLRQLRFIKVTSSMFYHKHIMLHQIMQKKLASTKGHPATWNDKIIILFDNLVWTVHEKIFSRFETKLLKYDENNCVQKIHWGLVYI